MARFDAELYLRLLGEETLLGGEYRSRGPFGSRLTEAASALVAVGATSAKKAQAVIDDYTLAEALRGDGGGPRGAMMGAQRSGRRKGKALKPRRVVACDRLIETSEGTLRIRHVSLAEDSTRLAVTIRRDPSRRRARPRGRMAMLGGGMGHPEVTLVDDHGLSTPTSFSGGGSAHEWEGHLTAHQPLPTDTAWIEIDGTRIELIEESTPCEVSVEQLADQEPAHRYLWQRLAGPQRFGQLPASELDAAIDALIAARVLAPDDPVIREVRAVHESLPQHPREPPTGGRTPRLPQPWSALLARRGRDDGPEGVITVGVVTPVFEGHSVGVMSLESDSEGFAVEVEVTGWSNQGPPFGNTIRTSDLVWWAADDCGNQYLGELGGSSGGDDHMEGTVNFWPALDPGAIRLDLMPTADTSHAVIRVPLAWATKGAPAAQAPA